MRLTSTELFRPIRTRRTFEEAVEQIADAISSRRLRPGDRLPSERVLAETMEVGRPTVREALQCLAKAGIVSFVGTGRGSGCVVQSDILPPALIVDDFNLRVSEVGGVLVARRMLEPRNAELAAAQRSDEDIERLYRLLTMMRDAIGHRSDFLDLDLRFHMEIARCTHNRTVQEITKPLMRRLEKAYDLALRDPSETAWLLAVEQHGEIVRMIARRDPEAAEKAVLSHLRILETMWEEESGYAFHHKLPSFLVDSVQPTVNGSDQ